MTLNKIKKWIINGSTLSILFIFSIIGLLLSAFVGAVIVHEQFNIGRTVLWFIIHSVAFTPVTCAFIYQHAVSNKKENYKNR